MSTDTPNEKKPRDKPLGELEDKAKEPIGMLAFAKWLVIGFALVALLFFALPGLRTSIGSTQVYMLEGMRIEASEAPNIALAKVLSKEPQIVREEMENTTSFGNSVVIIIASEAIRSIASNNRNVSAYVATTDAANPTAKPGLLGCNANNTNCGTPTIIVRYGSCNCMKIDSSKGQLTIEGDNAFIGDDTVKIGGIINLVLHDIITGSNSTNATGPIPTLRFLPTASSQENVSTANATGTPAPITPTSNVTQNGTNNPNK